MEENKKIYAVECGSWGSGGIESLFTNENKAKKIVDQYNAAYKKERGKDYSEEYGNHASVLEYDIDSIEPLADGEHCYRTWRYPDGQVDIREDDTMVVRPLKHEWVRWKRRADGQEITDLGEGFYCEVRANNEVNAREKSKRAHDWEESRRRSIAPT